MKRKAPKNGYDFGTKRQYRRVIWKMFAEHCPVSVREAQALLMPSIEGDEIEVALSKGFRERNLHVVDMNPAIVAHLKRRYPLINTYGVDVERAVCERLPRWTLHVANLDFCSTINETWVITTANVARWLAPRGVIAATYLKGRDPIIYEMVRKLKSFNEQFGEEARAEILRAMFRFPAVNHMIENKELESGYEPPFFRSGGYINGKTPMRWIAGQSALTLPRLPRILLNAHRAESFPKVELAEHYLDQHLALMDAQHAFDYYRHCLFYPEVAVDLEQFESAVFEDMIGLPSYLQ